MANISDLTDTELVIIFVDGDEKAFDELYYRYSSKLKRLIFYYIGDRDLTDDVLHEVFIRVFNHIDKFNLKMKFSSWIYQIAVNCSKNYLKDRAKRDNLLEKEKFRVERVDAEYLSPELSMINKYETSMLNEAIENLSDKVRDVFLLRFDHRIKYSEISEILNCSERTAKWRMKKAVELISLYLKEKGVI